MPELTSDDKNVRPVTTKEEDLHSASQRRTNILWEKTQSALAIGTMSCAVVVVVIIMLFIPDLRLAAFTFLATTVGTVVGFYFGRTNHQKVGGVDIGR